MSTFLSDCAHSRSCALRLRVVLCGLAALALASPAMAATGPVCRATTVGGNTADGSNWADQAMDLQTALGNSACTEVWVAAGTYKPTASNDRTVSFNVDPGVAVYGGFAGTESDLAGRNPAANPTILSGDLNGDDDVHFANNADNSYHVVYMDGTTGAGTITSSTVLDGFTISGGNANSSSAPDFLAGGLYCDGHASGNDCSPTLSNITFSGNSAVLDGAGMYNNGNGGTSSPTLSNITFSGNSAVGSGGGMSNDGNGGTSSPTLSNITFSRNSAHFGGGMYNIGNSSPTLSNVTFSGNDANKGGAMYNFGYHGTSSPTLRNVTFGGNFAGDGLAIYTNANGTGGSSSPTLSNVIAWGYNSASGPQIYHGGNTTAIIDHSVIQGGCTAGDGNVCTDVINLDPKLLALADNGGSTQTMLPDFGSSAIDTGDSSTCPGTDQRGIGRPQGPGCDIGAVEVEFDRTTACRVDASKPPPGDGVSWTSAYTDLQSALLDHSCSEVWVAAAVYTPVTSASPTATDRSISFSVLPGVQVYGGFAGTETQRSERDPAANLTTLSGDLNGDDDVNFANNADNSYHVVYMDGTTGAGTITSSTVLDGFTINGGNANSSSAPDFLAGGLYCDGHASGNDCSPTLSNITFSGNSAVLDGAGMYNNGMLGTSSPTLSNITFSGNHGADGGGMYNNGRAGTSSPTLSNITFSGNSAHYGGGMYNLGNSSPTLSNVTFSDNDANRGGAMFNNGDYGTSSPTLRNVTFSGNTAGYGGAIYTDANGTGGSSSPTLSNVIAWGDSAARSGPEIYHGGSTTAIIDHSVIEGGCNAGDGNVCTDVINLDPKLLALADNGGSTQTMLLDVGSSAIDTGDSTTCPGTDQRGIGRPQGSGCDIGAVEVEQSALTVSVTGAGNVSADATPLPVSGSIDTCISAGGNCSAYYAAYATVTLNANADIGQHFESWSGDCSGGASTSVTLDADKSCHATFAVNTHTIGGTVSGLAGSGLGLQLNGGDDLSISANGAFTFSGALDFGTVYTVTVFTQPITPAQTCTIGNGSGTLGDADVTSVSVDCATLTHTVTGTVGSGQGTINPPTQSIADGATADLTIAASTGWHIDTVTGCDGGLSGTVYTTGAITADCTVIAAFAINQYTVAPSVIGGHGTIDPATPQSVDYGATTSFTLTPAAHYHVDEVTGSCSGSLAGNVYTTNPITADCDVIASFATDTHTVGGSVTGLVGSDLVLRLNGGDPLLITQDGAFVFANPLDDLSDYAVTIAQQPVSPNQVCSVTHDSGTVDGSDITNVGVTCADTTPHLSVSVTDNHEYARYGMLIDYVVTVANDGTGDASGIRVSNLAPPQLDAAFTTWACQSTGDGATCGSGTGALDDNGVSIPIGRSLTWLVSAPLLIEATGETVDYTVDVSGPATASATDSDTLVILRTGFDSAYGDGAENRIGASVDACTPLHVSDPFDLATTYTIALDTMPVRLLIDTVLMARDSHGIGFRIERLNLGTIPQIRIVTIDRDGTERASEWASASETAVLIIATASSGGHGVLLVEGANTSLSLPLAQGMDATVTAWEPATTCD